MTWDEIWAVLQPALEELAAAVTSSTTGVASSSGRIMTLEIYPFGAYLSFGLENDASRDDVVVSIDGWRGPDIFRLTCDVALGDGFVLKDAPTLEVAHADLESSAEVRQWAQDVASFLRGQVQLITAELLATRVGE